MIKDYSGLFWFCFSLYVQFNVSDEVYLQGFRYGGGRGGLRFFSFFLKMKPPIWKHPPLHWNVKHPSMKWFLEKAQQRITQNLAKILEKYVWRSSFLVVNLQACRLIKWTPSHVFFDNILSPPHAPPMYWLKPPSPIKFWRASPHVLNTCGKPWFRTYSNMVFFCENCERTSVIKYFRKTLRVRCLTGL